ncbi:MAG: lipoprotein signal peptidase [Gammaproteobacteria bacterium]|nr:lipoprotein signal peptidase [Gammaproteobacteria bacterium]
MLRWLWLSVAVIALDQITKNIVVSMLPPYSPVELLPGLNFMLAYNTGAAFSFLADAGGWQRWFFVTLALAVSVFIVLWIKRLTVAERWVVVGLTLVLGGALGNVWDRIVIGHVVDFIDVYYEQWHWPAFNIADSAITVGVVLLLIDGLRRKNADDESAKRSE